MGVGNCASSLLQGIEYYRMKGPKDAIGLMHWDIGGHKPSDIDVVAAFDSIRCCKLALKRGKSGVLCSPAAYF